ncbi:hypothetical protein [Desulfuribacillus alkaliarsenatis]|uniref:DUF1614 domain-containing protein n=1 Tax=Desulfuribacillus alkaliarsenatis TaxID=766136 RepID=A0A1E5FZL0_9FIRM|nr:hypothetical protein [Desulfuribacillus alkaliarsenatis]OEF96025.1 hypothetical protein BHF68_09770 [Desulfuribacillus alkaliarsenatis]
MSQGIIASILVICFIILVLTDWFEALLKSLKLNKYYVVLILLSYFYLTTLWISIPYFNLHINVGGTALPIILMLWIYIKFLNFIQISETISVSMLVASLLLLVHEVFPKDPKLFIIDHFITYPLLLAVATVIIIKRPIAEHSLINHKAIASLISTILILDMLSILYIPREHFAYIGDGYANDLLFLSVLLVGIIYKIIELALLRKRNAIFRSNNLN